jgi:hypothetical protein
MSSVKNDRPSIRPDLEAKIPLNHYETEENYGMIFGFATRDGDPSSLSVEDVYRVVKDTLPPIRPEETSSGTPPKPPYLSKLLQEFIFKYADTDPAAAKAVLRGAAARFGENGMVGKQKYWASLADSIADRRTECEPDDTKQCEDE